jgi:nicotinate-nucleotide pyrophosphorylase
MRIRELRTALPAQALCYVEVRSQAELEAAFSEQLPAIQFDGFGIQALREAVKWVRDQPPPQPLREATGSVDPASLEAIAANGLTRIAADALTTQAPAIGMRMVLVP